MKNEFTKEVDIRRIGTNATHYSLKAGKQECSALAERFGVVAINSLNAEVDVCESDKNEYEVTGTFEVSLRQICGITLEEFDDTLTGDIDELFTTVPLPQGGAAELSMDTEIPTEIKGGIIDIGEVVAETVALAIPVFPKKQDAIFEYQSRKSEDENPFSVLKKLKK